MKTERTECSETSGFKTQTPGSYPKVILQHGGSHQCNRSSKSSTFTCAPHTPFPRTRLDALALNIVIAAWISCHKISDYTCSDSLAELLHNSPHKKILLDSNPTTVEALNAAFTFLNKSLLSTARHFTQNLLKLSLLERTNYLLQWEA